MTTYNSDFIEIIEAATKAPSGHNSQPWLFRLNDTSICIIPNEKAYLPIVDPYNRELFISIGALVENLYIKAQSMGYIPNIELDDQTKTIKVTLKQGKPIYNPLFLEIEKRQTNRKVYTGDIISDHTIDILENVFLDKNIHMYILSKSNPMFEIMTRYIVVGNDLQMNNDNFKEELLKYMRFNKLEINRNPTGLTYKVMGAPALPAFISRLIVKSYLSPNKQNKQDVKKIDSSSHLVLFTTKNNTWNEWINLGRSLERFVLTTTQLNLANAYMNQPLEDIELSQQIREKYPELRGEYPTLLLRIGFADLAPYSPRKRISDVIILDK